MIKRRCSQLCQRLKGNALLRLQKSEYDLMTATQSLKDLRQTIAKLQSQAKERDAEVAQAKRALQVRGHGGVNVCSAPQHCPAHQSAAMERSGSCMPSPSLCAKISLKMLNVHIAIHSVLPGERPPSISIVTHADCPSLPSTNEHDVDVAIC